LAVVSADGSAPAVPSLKEASYKAYPRRAQVRFPGEEWLVNSIPDRDQGRWIRLFGVLGMGILVLDRLLLLTLARPPSAPGAPSGGRLGWPLDGFLGPPYGTDR
jgi:hypothetical protein